MKAKTISWLTLALLPAVLFTLTSCSSTSKPPPAVGSARIDYTKGVPGGVIFQTFKTTATVTAIDQTNRMATLLAPGGKKFAVKVSPDVVGFDQIHVGDKVNATVTQRIVAGLDKEGAKAGGEAAAAAALTSKGDQPGGLAAESTQMTAKVIAIDPEKRTAKLRLENGSTETFPIREDLDLSQLKVGERVVFRVTEMVAIRMEKQ